MSASERRKRIIENLRLSNEAISASQLAKMENVSRQIIVGDIALLRAEGMDILATPRGYVYEKEKNTNFIKTIACRHSKEQLEDELLCIIDLGGKILDVVIEHPLYGQLVGQLQIASRYDVSEFIKKAEVDDTHLLSNLTNGIHLHTIECPTLEIYERILDKLKTHHYLFIDNHE